MPETVWSETVPSLAEAVPLSTVAAAEVNEKPLSMAVSAKL